MARLTVVKPTGRPDRRLVRKVIAELAKNAGEQDQHMHEVLDRIGDDAGALDAIIAITMTAKTTDIARTIAKAPITTLTVDAAVIADMAGAVIADTAGIAYDANANGVRQVLELCLKAARQMQEYCKVLAGKRALDEALPRHGQSVADLRKLIEGSANKNSYHPMVDWMPIPQTEQDRADRIASYPRAATAGLQAQRGNALVPGSAEYFHDALDRFVALIEAEGRHV